MLNGIAPSSHVFEGIRDLTSGCDLCLANLEIPLTNSKTKTWRKSVSELKAKDQWILKANPKHAEYIAGAGFTLVSLANNHAMDYGRAGLFEMTSLLDKYKISHAGAGLNSNTALRPAIVTLSNEKKVALLSTLGFMTAKALRKTTPATLDTPGVAVLNINGRLDAKAKEKLSRWIKLGRDKADFVIVGIHWGVERKPLPTPYQVALGRALIDAGADIVWGNHPHVLQGAEFYNGHLIMYSVGNLISNLPATTGFFKVDITDNGKQSIQFAPAKDAAGKVSLLAVKRQAAMQKAMKDLCRLLLRRYPSTVSVPAL